MTHPEQPPWIAVAGATGNCGREVLRAAKRRGLRVRALVRDEARLGEARAACDDVRTIDVTRRESLRGALDGATYVASALGKTRQADATPRADVDVGANLSLFDEAKLAGVRRIGLVSVHGARAGHPIAMMRMKGEAEEGLRRCGVPFVIVRPSAFFSDMWEVFQMARKGAVWLVGDGRVPINPISLEDLGDFIVDALLDDTKEGKAFDVGGPETFEMRDLASVAGRVLGRDVAVRTIPTWLAKAGVAMVKPFSRNAWELASFFVGFAGGSEGSTVAPAFGMHRLEDYFRERHEKEAP